MPLVIRDWSFRSSRSGLTPMRPTSRQSKIDGAIAMKEKHVLTVDLPLGNMVRTRRNLRSARQLTTCATGDMAAFHR